MGSIWPVLTAAFVFAFGRRVASGGWPELLPDYNVARGRLWSLVLLWLGDRIGAPGPSTPAHKARAESAPNGSEGPRAGSDRRVFRDILVAIDGSAHAARALDEGIDLAERDNARLTIMTAVPDPSAWLLTGAAYGGEIDYVALSEESERKYRELLDKAAFQVPQGVSVTKRLVHGRPGDRILEQIKEGRHDLVVMGSRGRGNVRSLVLGSVSHQVLNAAPAAVLIVHAEVGTDGSVTDS